jgi:D-alanine-D-alanine ligase
VRTDAIIEQYIEGRELYVGIIGNQRLQAFPTFGMKFAHMPEDQHRIATERVKWNTKYQKRMGISTGVSELEPAVADRVTHVARRVYQTLEMSGYGRIDLRLDAKGDIYVLEANPNPQIAKTEDFAEAAKRADIDYPSLLQRILSIGMRWEPERLG